MNDLDVLAQRASDLADSLSRPVDGRNGRDGRDGKDADPDLVAQLVERALADRPQPRDGRDGIDVDPAMVRREVELAVSRIKVNGERGPRGEQGVPGQIGPMPRHEWQGSKLRFEQQADDGTVTWGEWVDLRGPRGYTVGGNSTTAEAFNLNLLALGDPLILPDEVAVRQRGVWVRLGWNDFIALVTPVVYPLTLDGQALSLDGLPLALH